MADKAADKYIQVRKIGAGAFGEVHVVVLRDDVAGDGRPRLVRKTIPLAGGCGSGRRDNKKTEAAEAAREVRLLAQLDHPHIVQFVEAVRNAEAMQIVMEYCPGGDLAGVIAKARKARAPQVGFSEARIMRWTWQIGSALEYLHARRILHRDLKAHNVFVTASGDVKLGDFGIARRLASHDLASTMIGTPLYMAPEVLAGKPYGFKSDVWSLGCIVYELASFKHIVSARSLPELRAKVLRGAIPGIGPQYSREFRCLVRSLLSRSVASRPTIAKVMQSDAVRTWAPAPLRRSKSEPARNIVSRVAAPRARRRASLSGGSVPGCAPGRAAKAAAVASAQQPVPDPPQNARDAVLARKEARRRADEAARLADLEAARREYFEERIDARARKWGAQPRSRRRRQWMPPQPTPRLPVIADTRAPSPVVAWEAAEPVGEQLVQPEPISSDRRPRYAPSAAPDSPSAWAEFPAVAGRLQSRVQQLRHRLASLVGNNASVVAERAMCSLAPEAALLPL
ncbi:NEK protein kinase [Thecamonas trahens ATCC 50062]|uniref:non-specific serine/threonine protein kinase n=1 Tax=Thecamonas trahens ATCC 50062 TaxID=461836 RepID=A0A0L0DDP7_THETB|nr:NEK protein kinase [Thecamonas trahens ATCC 50062]KNC49433.1 NEK protein kinase [Thecamonas trahens ATCC 50062]|eukprot:XP_013757855.1 NEK protein kinase [Thecamonas trahens ATCC 50062]